MLLKFCIVDSAHAVPDCRVIDWAGRGFFLLLFFFWERTNDFLQPCDCFAVIDRFPDLFGAVVCTSKNFRNVRLPLSQSLYGHPDQFLDSVITDAFVAAFNLTVYENVGDSFHQVEAANLFHVLFVQLCSFLFVNELSNPNDIFGAVGVQKGALIDAHVEFEFMDVLRDRFELILRLASSLEVGHNFFTERRQFLCSRLAGDLFACSAEG